MKKALAFAGLVGAAMACASPAHAQASLTFIIDGDTLNQPFSILNSSTGGELVTGFGFTLNSGFIFDTANSPNFAAVGSTAVTTGLVSVPVVANSSNTLTLTFSDFDPGETFSFLLDVDPVTGNFTTLGNQLIGANVFVDFSNGQRGSGQLVAVPGNSDASQFIISLFAPTPSAVPEPTTWATMLLGFGAIGGALRLGRRRRLATAAIA